MKQQSGFTLIELIAVIVILGIIAAVAVPRFVDLSGAAEDAALSAVAGNMESAMALNYAAALAENSGLTPNPGSVAVDNCNDVGSLLTGGVPAGYAITDGALDGLGATAACTLTQSNSSKTTTFTGFGTVDAS